MRLELDNKTTINIFERLGNAKLKEGSHLFEKYGDLQIIKAAMLQTNDYNSLAKRKPGLALLLVVLSANRSYSKHVERHINRIDKDNIIVSFSDLKNKMQDREEFYKYWGHSNLKKYNTLSNLLVQIESVLKLKYGTITNEYDLINKWGEDVNLLELESNPLRIYNFALASIQHLRMMFGINTSKPDQRVLEVFKNEFGLKLNQKYAILAIEKIADMCKCNPLLIDQVFVNYGSGYYLKK